MDTTQYCWIHYVIGICFVATMISQSIQTRNILESQEIKYSNLVIRLEQVEKP